LEKEEKKDVECRLRDTSKTDELKTINNKDENLKAKPKLSAYSDEAKEKESDVPMGREKRKSDQTPDPSVGAWAGSFDDPEKHNKFLKLLGAKKGTNTTAKPSEVCVCVLRLFYFANVLLI
jgi:hypothetical protein